MTESAIETGREAMRAQQENRLEEALRLMLKAVEILRHDDSAHDLVQALRALSRIQEQLGVRATVREASDGEFFPVGG